MTKEKELKELFNDIKDSILKVEVIKSKRKWIIHLNKKIENEASIIDGIKQNINSIKEVKLCYPKFSLKEYIDKNRETILKFLRSCDDNIFLPKNNWIIESNKVTIPLLLQEDLEIIESSRIGEKLHKLFLERDNVNVIFNFECNNKIKNLAEEIDKERAKVKENIKMIPPKKACNKPLSESSIIFGKKITGLSIKISDMQPDELNILEGLPFDIEFRDIKNNKSIIIFNITDYTSSVTVKFFIGQDKKEDTLSRLKKAKFLKVKGRIVFDSFARENVLMADSIEELPLEVKTDDAEEKRVELHLHTQYSAMDSVAKVNKVIQKALDYGHKAVSITDHGVLQAFPEAMELTRGKDLKVIYGLEGYLVDDSKSCKWGKKNADLDDTFIVFDIETTGLSPTDNEIIEIGAVMVKNRRIVDTFSSFVKPKEKIPMKITELTGITNSMVENAKSIDEVLPKFIDFCGDSVLVAHNAKFDTSFIERACKDLGFETDFTVVDTLSLSRSVVTDISRHNLKAMTKFYKIKLDNHHRALDDAMATAKVYINLLDDCEKKGAKTIDDFDKVLDNEKAIQKMDTYHIVILVKNNKGLKNLYKLVSLSHLKYFYRRPRIPKSLLTKYREGLIIGSACESGELFQSILNEAKEEEVEAIANFYDYLEIQPLGNNQFLIDNNMVDSVEDLININKKIVQLGKKLDKPVVATGDVHFLEPHEEYYRRIIMHGKGFEDAEKQPPLYFRTTSEMLDEFYYLDEETRREVVITNTNLIADKIEKILPLPDGTFPPIIEGADQEIRDMVMQNAHKKYGNPLPKLVQDRIDKELNSIIKNGYAVLYLVAHKLVKKSNEDGYLVGSRGSVGSSLVATFTNITEVNPLPPHYICPECKNSEFYSSSEVGVGADLPDKNCPNCGTKYEKDGFDIPFETFLGFDGDKEPDIDLNFSGDYQPIAHKYTEELFGEGKTFKAGTIATVADKTAYGYVINYLEETGKVATNAEINRLVAGCSGIKRTTGQHPGGIMVVPDYKDIYDFCPIQRPADDVNSDVITTHFDYESLSGRLLKLDILGHDDPTIIKMLEDLTGVDAKSIPLDDKETMSLFTSTKALKLKDEDIGSPLGTYGIPEFGTPFVREMLLDTKPTAFADLIRISGLSHGTDVWINNAQTLIREGTATIKNVINTRDDIMIYLQHKGLPPKSAFTIMEKVRKGKGLNEEEIALMKEHGVPDWYIDSCLKIKYMFPKAHAAAYVTMAFRIAYFKVHHPLAYYAAYFSVKADEFDAHLAVQGKEAVRKAISEIKEKGNQATATEKSKMTTLELVLEMLCRGFEFLPIDLMESHYRKFIIKNGKLLPPFSALDGIGTKAARNIYEARKDGKFLSKEDLQARAKLSKTNIEVLNMHGTIASLPESNQISLFSFGL